MTHLRQGYGGRAVTALLLLPPILLAAQQRDATVAPIASGTATISGVVMSADAQAPMRRAIVTVTGSELPAPRSAITDDRGRFSIGRLPAGSFTVVAKKAAYLQAEFGVAKPGRPGSRVAVSAGETRSITLTMFRGAAIGGALRNVNGTPVVGVNVHAINARGDQDDIGPSESTVTNDRGEYRLYGLMPGEYLVVAAPVAGGSGEIGLRSAREMDALLATLKTRDNGSSSGAAAPRPSLPPLPPSVGYAPTYFPGTAVFSEGERLRVAAGEDRSNVSFVVTRVPVAAIEGAVVGNVPNLAAAQLTIIPEGWGTILTGPGLISFTAIPPNEKGEFKFGNVAPGRYRIVARVLGTPEPAAPGARGGGAGGGARIGGAGSAPDSGVKETLFGVADVDVRGQDVKGVNIPLQPGGVMTGRLVMDANATSPAPDLARIRLALDETGRNSYYTLGTVRVGNQLSMVPPAGVTAEGAFRIAAIGPAVYDLSITLLSDAAKTWKIRSAVVEGRDLLDTGLTGPFVNLQDVVVTLSDRRTEVAGALLSGANQPVNDYFVVAFSTNRAHWKPGARRSVFARPATNGRFVLADLPAGEYFIAALADLDPSEWQSAAFLEQVAPAAIKITIAEGEKKAQDLRIR